MTARILVVEDRPDIQDLVCERLRAGAEPFAVTAVASAHAALEQVALGGVDCVVLDYDLPDLNGLECLRRIRSRRPELPVVMLTAMGTEEVAVDAMKLGATDYLVKHGTFLDRLSAVLRAVLAQHALASANARIERAEMIGREAELDVLGRVLSHALGGSGQVVLLGGEAGIGKSRLALALDQQARQRGCRVLWGRCHDSGGAPAYGHWFPIVRSCLADAGTLGESLGPTAADLAPLALVGERAAAGDAQAPTSDEARFRLFDGVASLLKLAARQRPLVIVLDDLHRADVSSMHLFQYLGREIGDAAVLMVGAYRAAELERDRPLRDIVARMKREPRHHASILHGLTPDEVRRLLTAFAGHGVPTAFSEAIYRRTDGNPLFVREMVQFLQEEDVLFHDGARWTSRFTPDELRIPDGLRELIRHRMAHLGAPCRDALATASVMGREFSLAALLALDGAADADALAEAMAARVLSAVPGALDVYRFVQPLMRETLYDDLPGQRRSALHQRFGEWLETRHGAAPGPHAALLAYHFCEAARGGDVGRALHYARQAGGEATAAMAHVEAVRLYDAALRALRHAGGGDETQRGELLLLLGESLWRAGEFDRARQVALQAVDCAEQLGAVELFARAALCFAGRLRGFGAVTCDETVVHLLGQALRRLPPADSPLRALAAARLAEELTLQPDHERRWALGRDAVEMARRLGDPAVLAAVLTTTYWALWVPEQSAERLALAGEVVAIAEQTGDSAARLGGQLCRVCALVELGHVWAARREFDACAPLARDLGQPYLRWMTMTMEVCLALAEGRVDDAEPLIQAALPVGEQTRNQNAFVFAGVQAGHLLWLRGDFEALRATLNGFADNYPLLMPMVRCSLAVIASEQGRLHDARREFERLALSNFDELPRNVTWVTSVACLAQVCATLGDADRAAQLYALLRPFEGRNVALPPVVVWGAASHYLGLLAATLHRWDDAARHFDEAIAGDAALGKRHWVVRSQLAFAEMLLARGAAGDREQATGLLDDACATAGALHLPTVVARAETLRQRTAAPGVVAASPLAIFEAVPLDRVAARASAPGTMRRGILRREGEFWIAGFQDERGILANVKGLQSLAELLRVPGRSIPAVTLYTNGKLANSRYAAGSARADGLSVVQEPPGGGDPLLDSRALEEYHARLRALSADHDEAMERGETERAARIEEEMERIEEEVLDGTGLGGRSRVARGEVEKIRQNVQKNIHTAMMKIAANLPALHDHLSRHVQTGVVCVYVPDLERPVIWDL